jgi:hypothetical protein
MGFEDTSYEGRFIMSERKLSLTIVTSLIASILIIANGLWIFYIGTPIVVVMSSFEATTVEQVLSTNTFWGRIVFGISGLTGQLWTPIWIAFAVIMLIYTVALYLKPKAHKSFSLPIAILSLLSLPIGGGFYLGASIGLIGAMVGLEWPVAFKETFIGRIIRAARLDSKLCVTLSENANLSAAALTIIFVGILSGIGNGLYTYNADSILKGGSLASGILLRGQIAWNEVVLITAVSIVGMAVIKWLILSLAIYWIGAKLAGISSSFNKIAAIIAFAYVPEGLLAALPLLFSNQPTLTFNWPVGLYIITHLWALSFLVIAISQVFELGKGRALGVAILGGTFYWIIYHMFIVPTLNVPGVEIVFTMPSSSLTILAAIGVAMIAATALGVFSRKPTE